MDEKNTSQAPVAMWWILVHVFSNTIHTVNICFKSLQGKNTSLSEQKDRLTKCSQNLRTIIAISWDSGSAIDAIPQAATNQLSLTVNVGYTGTRGGILGLLEGIGSSIHQLFNSLPEGKEDVLIQLIGDFLVGVCSRVNYLVAAWGPQNASSFAKISPVLLKELFKLSTRKVFQLSGEQQKKTK